MVGSTVLCPLCGAKFFGKQKCLFCSVCGVRNHVACLKISDVKYTIFKKNGNFKCSLCLRKRQSTDDNTPVNLSSPSFSSSSSCAIDTCIGNDSSVLTPKVIHSVKPAVDSANRALENSNFVNDFHALLSDGIHQILRALRKEISSVKEEISLLRTENQDLKQTVSELKIRSAPNIISIESSKSDLVSNSESTVLKKNLRRRKGHKKVFSDNVSDFICNSNFKDDNSVKEDSNNFNDASQADILVSKNPRLNGSPSIDDSIDDPIIPPSNTSKGAWTTVVKKIKGKRTVNGSNVKSPSLKPKPFKIGSNSDKVNLVRPKMKALFVSRFNPTVSELDVKDLLQGFDLAKISCNKLRTKFSSYSSFHVEVPHSDYEKISDPSVWPQGILVAPFFGKLVLRQEENQLNEDKPKEVGSCSPSS